VSSRFERAPVYLAGAAAVTAVISIVASEIFMALALLALLLRGKWRTPPATPWPPAAVWPIVAWMTWTLISLAASGHFREGLPQIKKFIWFAMFFIVYNALRELRDIRGAVLSWTAAALLSSLWSFEQFARKYRAARAAHLNFYTAYVADRITGFMGHWMTFSGQMMMALMLLGALLLLSRDRKWKLPLSLAALLIAIGLFLAETRSMWGGAVAGAIYLLWVGGRRWLILSIPVLAALLYLANPFSVRERIVSIAHPHGDLDSNEHRAVLRIIGRQMIRAHPLLGVGPEQVGRQYQNYIPPEVSRPLPTGYYGHLHNIYYHYAAERGLPALAALLWLLLGSVWHFAIALRRAPPESEARWVLHGVIAVIIAVMVGGYYEVNLGDSEVLAMFLAALGCGYSAAQLGARARYTEAERTRRSLAEG
jgi:putative inorganic carbon (hco3(-)) transporter